MSLCGGGGWWCGAVSACISNVTKKLNVDSFTMFCCSLCVGSFTATRNLVHVVPWTCAILWENYYVP